MISELTRNRDIGPLFDKSKHTVTGRALQKKKATKVPKISKKKRVTRTNSGQNDVMNAPPIAGSKAGGSERNTRPTSKRSHTPVRQTGGGSSGSEDDASYEDSSSDYVDEDKY